MTQTLKKSETLETLLAGHVAAMETNIDRWLVEPGTPGALADAMRYCVAGGKRLRPALVRMSARAVGWNGDGLLVDRAALAVEMVHVYSLVHDDLPAMDDDDLRRGRPTAHVKFGQAMAILTGDALLTGAMGLLAQAPLPQPGLDVRARMVAELAAAAGALGMVAGQVADMELCDVPQGQAGLEFVHTRKTGRMLQASARLGAIAVGAEPGIVGALGEYAAKLGLAFQIFDDLLDVTASANQLGKTPGKDAQANKKTYLTVLGYQQAEQLGQELTNQAIEALAPLGDKAVKLKTLAKLLVKRRY